MSSLTLRDRITRTGFHRKLLWLVMLTMLSTVMIIIIPRVSTPAPAIDSKMLATRMLMAALLALAAINWRTLARHQWQFTDTLFAGLSVSFLVSAAFSGRMAYCLSEFWHLGAFYLVGWLV